MSTTTGIPYIQVWVADTLTHVWKTGEPLDVFGARVMLWLLSCEEDPPGTLPDDLDKWSDWLRMDATALRPHYDRITSGWTLRRDGRWEIRRIADHAKHVLHKRKVNRENALKKWAAESPDDATAERPHSDRIANAERTQCIPDHPIPDQPKPSQTKTSPTQTSPDNGNIARQAREVWDHALALKAQHGGRSIAYTYTDDRRKKIAARLRELDKLKRREEWPEDLVEIAKGVIEEYFTSPWHRERGITDFCKGVFHSWPKFERWLNEAWKPE